MLTSCLGHHLDSITESEHMICLWTDSIVPGFTALTGAVVVGKDLAAAAWAPLCTRFTCEKAFKITINQQMFKGRKTQ